MARGGGLNLIGAVLGQAALFGVVSILGNVLGEAAVGRYSVLYAMLTMLSLLSLAGFRAGLTRFVAMFLADGDAARVRGTIRLGLGVNIAASAVIGGLLALGAPWVASVYNNPDLAPGIRWMALALPAASFSDAALSATQGWRSQREFALIGRIFDPLSQLLLTGAFLLLGWGVNGAIIAIPVAAWATAILAALALAKRLRSLPKAAPVYEARRIFSFSLVSWGSALAQTGLVWAGTLILGAMASEEEVGVFTMAARLVSLAVFVMTPIINTFSPHVAHLHHIGDRGGVSTAYGSATRWIVQLSAPAFVALLLVPDLLLRVLGGTAAAGATAVIILAVGQMVSAAAGPCGVVLNMSGKVSLSLIDNVGVLLLNIVLNIVLIPEYGIIGAAIAFSAALIIGNLAKVAQVRMILGVEARRSALLRTALVGAVSAIWGWGVRDVSPTWWLELLIVLAVVGVVYVGTLAWVGLDREDLRFFRSLTKGGRKPAQEAPTRPEPGP